MDIDDFKKGNHFFRIFYTLVMALVYSRTSATPTIKLSSGYQIPVVGLGTWQVKPEDVDKVVTAALDSGYRHIDTAFDYGNEEAIGRSLKKWFDNGGNREDLFITTKLPPHGNRPSDVEIYLKKSLEYLGVQYIDLYLMHAPITLLRNKDELQPLKDEHGNTFFDNNKENVASWKVMEEQVRAGRVRSIGVSNFNESELLSIINNATINPSNLQIELHAYNQQKPLRELCAKHNITVTAYSTLGSTNTSIFVRTNNTQDLPRLMENPVVQEIAQNHNKTAAQVLLRYIVQNDIVVLPKSNNPSRIKANIDIFDFELDDDEMKKMNDLDRGERGVIFKFTQFEGWQ